jgi:hypothetical protein
MSRRGWCALCGGWGWRDVTEDEITEQLRLDADHATVAARRAMLVNSVRPCDICEPRQYQLWKEGHMRPGHRCETCRPPRATRRRRSTR